MLDCFKYNIDLAWLNTLGGWEHWRFTAFKSYGYDISDVNTFERDIFQNWDTDFINGQTQTDTLSLTAKKTLIVRSQDLTIQQIEAIARVKISIKVIDETDINKLQTVIVDKSSFTYRTDNDKRHSTQFNIERPSEIIQVQ